MADVADSNLLRVLAYLAVAACALAARRREDRRAGDVDGVWPPFYWLTAGLLAAMAIGRLGDIGGLLADLGRARADDEGWYASRRPIQAAVVASVAGTWLTVVSLAVWRVPERRRRYLPMSVMALTLLAYAAVRLVSLHHVDVLLYHREVAGVRLGSIIELALLAVTAAVSFWVPDGSRHPAEPRRSLPVGQHH